MDRFGRGNYQRRIIRVGRGFAQVMLAPESLQDNSDGLANRGRGNTTSGNLDQDNTIDSTSSPEKTNDQSVCGSGPPRTFIILHHPGNPTMLSPQIVDNNRMDVDEQPVAPNQPAQVPVSHEVPAQVVNSPGNLVNRNPEPGQLFHILMQSLPSRQQPAMAQLGSNAINLQGSSRQPIASTSSANNTTKQILQGYKRKLSYGIDDSEDDSD